MFGRKRIIELEEKIEELENDLSEVSKYHLEASTSEYKFKKLFSKLFTKLQFANVKRYKVNNDLTDGLATLYIECDDNTNYTYEIKLVATGCEEILRDEQTRQN